jgi:DNA-binding transcriptional ArsR family regulator
MDALQVIAEPRRREILRLLWKEEMAAGEVAGHFELTFGAVSQHLSVLREASLVVVRKEGNRRLYKANHDALAPYREILESMWGDLLGDLKATVESNEA